LQFSWDTYGEANFDFYILEECDVSVLDERETYYIAELKTQNEEFGYNIEPGGHILKTLSEETKQKISERLKGRKPSEKQLEWLREYNRTRVFTEETRQKMKDNHPDFKGENHPQFGTHKSEETKRKIVENRKTLKGADHPNFGKSPSDETREKLRQSHVGLFAGNKHPRCRPVYCPELNEEFWGAKEVESKYGIRACYIAACLSGEQKTAGKHPDTGEPLHWSYIANDDIEINTIQND
jgi:group I intron endonuclease